MRKSKKKVYELLLCGIVGGLSLTLGGILCDKKACKTAYASSAVTETADENDREFRMKAGASVRLNVIDGLYGIRFGAEVADREKEYVLLIVPAAITEKYETEKESGEKLSEYCERIAMANGGELAKAEGLKANNDGEISASLVDVKWSNLNREFEGIAYYTEENGNRVEAARAEESDRKRSVYEVAEKATSDVQLSAEEKVAAEELRTAGEKEKKGIAIDESLRERYLQTIESESDGAVSIEKGSATDDAGWHINGGKKITVSVDEEIGKERLRSKGGTVTFYLKSRNGAGTATFYEREGTGKRTETLKGDEKKEIIMPTTEYLGYGKIRFENDSEEGGYYYVSEIVEESAEEAGKRVETQISSIKETWEDGEETEIALQVDEAETRYSQLSAEAKAYVKNYEKIARIKAKLSASAETRKKLIEATEYADFITKGMHATFGAGIEVSAEQKTGEQSEAWSISKTIEEVSTKTEVMMNWTEEIKSKTAGYDTIVVYVYVKRKKEEATPLRIGFSEGKLSGESTTETQRVETITDGVWAEITIPRDEFIRYQRITGIFDGNDVASFYISSIYGKTSA